MSYGRTIATGGTRVEHHWEAKDQDRPPGSCRGGRVSRFSAVDASPTPELLVDYLDGTTRGQWAIKNYVAAAFTSHGIDGPVLDVGCGSGGDLGLLRASGYTAVGVDNSRVMLDACAQRGAEMLVQSDGSRLPFSNASFGACRIERVLMHVADPESVVREAARCLRPGGLLAMFEPDWLSLEVETDDGRARCGWLNGSRHPGVGAHLWDIAETAGLAVVDRVEELSVWRDLEALNAIVGGARQAVTNAIGAGRVDRRTGEDWYQLHTKRNDERRFRAFMRKVLVLACKP